jgi:hypothetical protein
LYALNSIRPIVAHRLSNLAIANGLHHRKGDQ